MQIDPNFYNSILQMSQHVALDNTPREFAQRFANDFVAMHHPNDPRSAQNVSALYNHTISQYNHFQNGQGPISPNDLAKYIFPYIEREFRSWYQQVSARGPGVGMTPGGYGGYSGGGYSGGSVSGGYVAPGRVSHTPGSHLSDDHTPSPAPAPTQQTAAPATTTAGPVTGAFTVSPSTTFTNNPLDVLMNEKIRFNTVKAEANWGTDGVAQPKDDSIVIMDHRVIQSQDDKFSIERFHGFKRAYFNDPLDVAKDFFHIVPDTVLAVPFIFRMFYNHVEEIDISTESFLHVRDEFLAKLNRPGRAPSVYNVLKEVLNSLNYGATRAVSKYLTRQINRALFLACRRSERPEEYIEFEQIEDLEELLGSSFQNPILNVPNGRSAIVRLVNTAILNSFAGMTDVMFKRLTVRDVEIVKSSPVFPDEMAGIYPNKTIIPSGSMEEAVAFFAEFKEKRLNTKTYVRQIRSVIFTNILGQSVLSTLQDQPQAYSGEVPGLLNAFALDFFSEFDSNPDGLEMYDFGVSSDSVKEEYDAYLRDPETYVSDERTKFSDRAIPELPVDQTIFAIQYKKDPKQYMQPVDLCITLDGDPGDGQTYLAKAKVDAIVPVR